MRLPRRFESGVKLSHIIAIGRAEIEPAALSASSYSRLDSLADRGAAPALKHRLTMIGGSQSCTIARAASPCSSAGGLFPF